jgi:signal transduction histidine kinase
MFSGAPPGPGAAEAFAAISQARSGALVENAVRHGAAPRVAPSDIVVTATGTRAELALSVRNTGDAVSAPRADGGTGLRRLRERLEVLHGGAARLSRTAPFRRAASRPSWSFPGSVRTNEGHHADR